MHLTNEMYEQSSLLLGYFEKPGLIVLPRRTFASLCDRQDKREGCNGPIIITIFFLSLIFLFIIKKNNNNNNFFIQDIRLKGLYRRVTKTFKYMYINLKKIPHIWTISTPRTARGYTSVNHHYKNYSSFVFAKTQ